MSRHGIRSKVARPRFRPPCTTDSDHPDPVAPNLLGRDFAAERPDRKWCVDITYVPTDEGSLYLAAVHRPVLPADRRLGDGRPHAGDAVPGRAGHGGPAPRGRRRGWSTTATAARSTPATPTATGSTSTG